MSEETAHDLPDSRSFEERVFARFDAFDARFDAVDAGLLDLGARVEKLENESERRAADTKPIWERALAGIAAVRQDVIALTGKLELLDHKVTALGNDMLTLRARQSQVEVRMDKIESKPAT
jgi:chromosome segregation ATPase